MKGDKTSIKSKIKYAVLCLLRAIAVFFLVNVAIIFAVFIGSTGYFGFHIEKELIVLPLFYILPPILYIFFEEYNQDKKARVTVFYTQKPGILKSFSDSFWSRYFWASVLPLLLLLFFFDIGNVLILLCPKSLKRIFLIRTLFEILLYLIPETVVFLFAEGALRRDWYRCWKMNCFQIENGKAKLNPIPKGRCLFNVAITVFGGALIHIFFLTILGLIGSITSLVVRDALLSFLTLLAVCLVPFLRWQKVASAKARFKKRLVKAARDHNFHFEWNVRPLKDSQACSGQVDFILETKRERIAGSFLPVHSKRAIIYFLDEAFYCFEKRFFWWWIFYPRHKYKFDANSDQKPLKKVLILTQESNNIRAGDEDVSRPSCFTDTVNGYEIHSVYTFFNYIDRVDRLF
ncbi:MAG: hypothetical protein IKJ74_04820 [Clostridia bacterium]|nr:hypothetical protein [Clostridia bacterium]